MTKTQKRRNSGGMDAFPGLIPPFSFRRLYSAALKGKRNGGIAPPLSIPLFLEQWRNSGGLRREWRNTSMDGVLWHLLERTAPSRAHSARLAPQRRVPGVNARKPSQLTPLHVKAAAIDRPAIGSADRHLARTSGAAALALPMINRRPPGCGSDAENGKSAKGWLQVVVANQRERVHAVDAHSVFLQSDRILYPAGLHSALVGPVQWPRLRPTAVMPTFIPVRQTCAAWAAPSSAANEARL